jgi:phosphoribosylformylglycinamidine (FGAM) synthase PurS component
MQVRGGDLFEFLADMRQEEVSEDQAKYMFAQLLAGPQFLLLSLLAILVQKHQH